MIRRPLTRSATTSASKFVRFSTIPPPGPRAEEAPVEPEHVRRLVRVQRARPDEHNAAREQRLSNFRERERGVMYAGVP